MIGAAGYLLFFLSSRDRVHVGLLGDNETDMERLKARAERAKKVIRDIGPYGEAAGGLKDPPEGRVEGEGVNDAENDEG